MATGTPYNIQFTDPTVPGKTPFIIQPGTTDGPLTPITASPDSTASAIHTSIVLPGMGLVTYGERVAETFVHILENFASATPPVAPTIGQIWYDYGNTVCKVWDGTEWAYVGSPWYYIASTDEYNAMVNLYNEIAATPTGIGANAYGYGQAPLATLAENVKPQPTDWQNLYNAMVNIGAHQLTSTATLPMTDFRVYSDPLVQTYGIASLMLWYQIYLSTLNSLATNRFNIDPTTLETSIPSGATSSRTTQWDSTIQQQIVYTFIDDAHMRAYFNSGGSISVTPSINSNAGAANAAWYTLFTQMGVATLKVNSSAISGSLVADTGLNQYTGNGSYHGSATGVAAGGFYAMYTAGDNVQVKLLYVGLGASISAYTGVTGFWLLGSKNSAAGTLTLTVSLVNGNLQNGTGADSGEQFLYNSPGMVGSSAYPATMMSSQTLTKASPLQLNNPEIEYPAATATVLLSQAGVGGIIV